MLILLLLATCAFALQLDPDIFKRAGFTPQHRLVALSIEYDKLVENYKQNGDHSDVMKAAVRMAELMGQIEWLMFRHNVTMVNITTAGVT
jgi:hypothetical protein